MILNKETGMRIRKLMAENRITVREMQERLGLESPQAVYKWLHGNSLPALDNLLVLSRILGVRMEDILVWEETSGYPPKIESGVLKEQGKRGGPIPEGAWAVRRKGKETSPSRFPDLQAVVRWNQRACLTRESRRILLRLGRGMRREDPGDGPDMLAGPIEGLL